MLRKLAKYKTHVEKLQLDIHFTSMAQGLWFRTNWASLSFKKKDIWYQNEKPFFCQQNNNHMWKQKRQKINIGVFFFQLKKPRFLFFAFFNFVIMAEKIIWTCFLADGEDLIWGNIGFQLYLAWTSSWGRFFGLLG